MSDDDDDTEPPGVLGYMVLCDVRVMVARNPAHTDAHRASLLGASEHVTDVMTSRIAHYIRKEVEDATKALEESDIVLVALDPQTAAAQLRRFGSHLLEHADELASEGSRSGGVPFSISTGPTPDAGLGTEREREDNPCLHSTGSKTTH